MSIDYSARLADKYYNEGKYADALRWAYKAYSDEIVSPEWPDMRETYARIADIYEAMGLHGSALNWLYKYLHEADEQDLPEIYEGLAVNYLNMGKETQSAYYYNKLIDADETLPPEAKMEIVEAFSKPKKNGFRFVYPPKLADYSKELSQGSKALKEGNGKDAVLYFSQIEKGSKDYETAKEMQAVAHLLCGEVEEAKLVCERLLEDNPNDVRAMATLCAVYLERDERELAEYLANQLCEMSVTDTDDIYKVATVCCEMGMHDEAYKRFCTLEKEMPYDGRTTYFKAVSAYKSGKYDEAERTLDMLCSIYPDAEVAKYYLTALRAYRNGLENGETPDLPTPPGYFYHLPQAERETRCKRLIQMTKLSREDAWLFADLQTEEDIRWCFDEMDGADHELQYLGIVVAERTDRMEMLQDVLLDCEVLDVLKIETLRLLYERNKRLQMGIVLYHIYRKLELLPIKIGRKRQKRYINAYAKVASKIAILNDGYAERLKTGAEELYKDMQARGVLDCIDSEDDLACAIFVSSGIKEIYGGLEAVCAMFDGNPEKVQALLTQTAQDKQEKDEKEG
ncbi:MAG: hypothetical protein IJ996_04105 [Clostridia bacterium]|nr:hypothetical protein [Clostridia bacterium]